MTDFTNRFDLAQPHRDKGFRWGSIATWMAVPILLLWPVNVAVEDDAWSAAIAAVSIAGLAFQIFALVRSIRSHRRANKILDGDL